MATAFFGGNFFGGEFFSVAAEAEEAARSGGGGIDPGEGLKRRYPPVKPTGILHLPKRGKQAPAVEERIEEAAGDRAEIASRLAREFGEETALLDRSIETMTMAEVEAEIGTLLRRKIRTDEEEVLLLLLMIAASQ